MGGFVAYIFQSAVVMTFLYLAYKWLLAPSTFHGMNRFVIISIYIMSWVLPLFVPFIHVGQPHSPEVVVELPAMQDVFLANGVQPEPSSLNWWSVLVCIYYIGVSLVAIFSIICIWHMLRIIRSGSKIRKHGYVEVISDRTPGPFSWLNYVVLRHEDLDESYDMVLDHELAHLRMHHWLDLIPAWLTAVTQWFSPAAWLMMRELRDIHEYEVDARVSKSNPTAYQLMLIRKTAGAGLPIFADSLNHSQIKKRITMMMTKKTSPMRRAAAIALPAVAALSLLTLSQPIFADIVSNVRNAVPVAVEDNSVSDYKISDSASNLQTAAQDAPVTSGTIKSVSNRDAPTSVASESEVMAERPAVAEAADQTKEEKKQMPQPQIFVDGKLYTGALNDIDPKTIVKMEVVKNDPAYPDGKIMITSGPADESRIKDEKGVFTAPAKIADFKGGQEALMIFLGDNVKWPAGAPTTDKPIRAIVQFTVNVDGTVTDAKVMRKTTEVFDNEAVRVVNLTSGHWVPAEYEGKPVASKFTIPITFQYKE